MTYEPSPEDEAKLQAAQEFIEQENYAAAKAILNTMPNNPQAQTTIAQLLSEGEKPKRDDGDPYGQDEFYEGEPSKVKRVPEPEDFEDYTSTTFLLIAYMAAFVLILSNHMGTGIVVGLAGLALNIAYRSKARNAQQRGDEVHDAGHFSLLFLMWGLFFGAIVVFLKLIVLNLFVSS